MWPVDKVSIGLLTVISAGASARSVVRGKRMVPAARAVAVAGSTARYHVSASFTFSHRS